MLKKIPTSISPDLLQILAQMGHGDEIVLGDGNFPGETLGKRVVRADGIEIPELLSDILALLPLDQYSDWKVGLMQTVGDDLTPPIWDVYEKIITQAEEEFQVKYFERFAFYEQTKKAFAVVMTSETALYGNIILKKGVVTS